MGEEGLCLSNQKCMCLSQAIQCIPTKPFIEVASICKQRCRVFGAHTHAYTYIYRYVTHMYMCYVYAHPS